MRVFSSRYLVAALAVMLFAPLVPAQTSGQNPGGRASDAPASSEADDDRYIVELPGNASQRAQAVRAAGGQVMRELPEYDAVAARLPARALAALRNNPNVRSIERDARRYPLALGDTVVNGETVPFGILMVQADQVGMPGARRKVCIIDSGYYLAHDDLPDSGVSASADSGTGNPYTDGSGHGTHVAGTIAAMGGNGLGVVGVNPDPTVDLHIVKVFGDNGQWAYSSDLAAALSKCRQAGAQVVNMSLGGSFSNKTEQNAFDQAYQAGVLSIAAAGNDGSTRKSYPASYSSVVSVAALDQNKAVAAFSQKNDQVELAAPGVSVLSTVPYAETNTLAVNGATYSGNYIEFAARTAGVTGGVVNGGRCTSTGAWSGQVVLCERGDVSFYDKVRNVQLSSGKAAVIYNNEPGNFFGTLGAGNSSTIPAISLSREDGQVLLATALGAAGTVVSQFEKPASGYAHFDGTSMATPHVAGVAALIWGHHPTKTNAEIRKALQDSAQDLGAAGKDNSYGYGLVQAKAALDLLAGGPGGGGGGGGSDPDTTPPVISAVRSVKGKGNAFDILWNTDEAANSSVTFTQGATGTFTDAAMVTEHKMTFRGSKGVTYKFFVTSADASGNTAQSPEYTHQN
jgi:serine protease